LNWVSRASSSLPCIGIHIRHGDIRWDHRHGMPIDRSLDHHVALAREAGKALGISNFYLATDNETNLEVVADRYPDMHWYAQLRPLKTNAQVIV
jgi:hypothetical protein